MPIFGIFGHDLIELHSKLTLLVAWSSTGGKPRTLRCWWFVWITESLIVSVKSSHSRNEVGSVYCGCEARSSLGPITSRKQWWGSTESDSARVLDWRHRQGKGARLCMICNSVDLGRVPKVSWNCRILTEKERPRKATKTRSDRSIFHCSCISHVRLYDQTRSNKFKCF
jgi:hypothetical protein